MALPALNSKAGSRVGRASTYQVKPLTEYRTDVKLMLAMRDEYVPPAPLPTLEKVLANMEKAKELAGGRSGRLSVEALSLATRDEAGM